MNPSAKLPLSCRLTGGKKGEAMLCISQLGRYLLLQSARRELTESALELEKTRKLLLLQRDLTAEQQQRAEELEGHLMVCYKVSIP